MGGSGALSMNEPQKQFQTFEDLEVYQVARTFRKSMYGIIRRLPEEEKHALASPAVIFVTCATANSAILLRFTKTRPAPATSLTNSLQRFNHSTI
jgi:hypothetical protein